MSFELPIAPYTEEDDLAGDTARDGMARLRVYRPKAAAIVLGRGSRPEIEIDLEAWRRDPVPIFRRRGGGCSVVLDPGNLVIALAQKAKGIGGIPEHFQRISLAISRALASLGLPGIRMSGHSDLTLGDRKIGGASMVRSQDLLLYSTTLLFAPDLARMETLLCHPPREPAYRRGRSHREFVSSLQEFGKRMALEEWKERLSRLLSPNSLAIYGSPVSV